MQTHTFNLNAYFCRLHNQFYVVNNTSYDITSLTVLMMLTTLTAYAVILVVLFHAPVRSADIIRTAQFRFLCSTDEQSA